MNSEAPWVQAAQQFQQTLGDSWSKAMATFSGLDLSAAGTSIPRLSFDTEKLQALQQAYVTEAAELWNKGLGAQPADKRFASDAWAGNPVASFSAAVYLLNARTMLGSSLRRPATKLIISGIIASTQGFEAVSIPPTKTATTASQAHDLLLSFMTVLPPGAGTQCG